ncbi:hypothetical protein NQ176_g3282 [Zarea fungicola]|uniref:Uncharacterized protein n=1 Tax=Zarea fungicola TaxID=93591 RepID=A0ACC1NJZ3_9HYPO|nr:hypothetical protein NQ176_g3282 [Lecanicillium fungicola]
MKSFYLVIAALASLAIAVPAADSLLEDRAIAPCGLDLGPTLRCPYDYLPAVIETMYIANASTRSVLYVYHPTSNLVAFSNRLQIAMRELFRGQVCNTHRQTDSRFQCTNCGVSLSLIPYEEATRH